MWLAARLPPRGLAALGTIGGACEAGGPGPRSGCGDGRNESHAECGFMKFRLQNYIIHMIVRHKPASLTKIRQKSIKKS